jgi:outer membrane protein TolC
MNKKPLSFFSFWIINTAGILLIGTTFVFAQTDSLTLSEALKKSLANNHAIEGAQQNKRVAENNVTPGNANLLPSVNLEASYQEQFQNTRTEFANPEMAPIEADGANTTTYNAGISLDYVLFNGLTRFRTLERLRATRDQSRAETDRTIEQTLLATAQTFLRVARLSETVEIDRQALAISQERLERAETAYQFGSSTKLQVLNARVDLNRDSANLLESENQLTNAKRELAEAMGQTVSTELTVSRSVRPNENLELSELRNKALERNQQLRQAEAALRTARLQKAIADGNRTPRISLNSQYGYTRQDYEANFLSSTENLGLTAGINLAFNLYDGRQRQLAVENAQVRIAQAEAQRAQAEKAVERSLANAYDNYQNRLRLWQLEKRNVETARLNFERSREAYRTGSITSTQLREAQLNFIQARQRVTNLRYDIKSAELELLQASGQIIEAQES